MADWNAALYRQFEQERTRPAQELLDRVALEHARTVIDLGCGPGNSTELLVRRFPAADVLGLDSSEDMLASARQRLPQTRFTKADIASWQPERAPDLLYANAALQWVPDHAALFPRLLSLLQPGGVLAVQMPDNLDEPSHRLMREVAADGPWAALIGDASAKRAKRLPAADYYDLLAGLGDDIDIWRTTYYHLMPSAEAIVTWVRATGLRPFLDPLPAPLQAEFLATYQRAIDDAYPSHAGGTRLLAFPRLFIVARRRG
ncbi:MAG TPA: trans-aconitate 2-methyltransferase [Terriglobales bacterium]|nr:trans-aconitate 2-methyltransferase [Terriglobales bacterium]